MVGLGYVGTVVAVGLADAGHRVVGLDINQVRIEELRSGRCPIYEPGLELLVKSGISKGDLEFVHREAVDRLDCEAVVIATGTPPNPDGSADLQQVRDALDWIKLMPSPSGSPVVVMKSTVPPGTGQGIIERELKETGFSYVSNPEFLREGWAVHDWQHPHHIVIGASIGDSHGIDVVKRMHVGLEAPYTVTDITSAEMIKSASNAFLATRISFINEIANLCDQVGASIEDVSEALSLDPRHGSRIFPGIGFGGSCLPKDIDALKHLSRANGLDAALLHSVAKINNRQRMLPLRAVIERFKDDLSGVKIAVLGMAFKPGTDDVRDAPSIDLITALADTGAAVYAYDPQAAKNARPRLPASVCIVPSIAEAIEDAQATVVATEWDEIVSSDWSVIARGMKQPRMLFDGRNTLDPRQMRKLGFEYIGIGRQ